MRSPTPPPLPAQFTPPPGAVPSQAIPRSATRPDFSGHSIPAEAQARIAQAVAQGARPVTRAVEPSPRQYTVPGGPIPPGAQPPARAEDDPSLRLLSAEGQAGLSAYCTLFANGGGFSWTGGRLIYGQNYQDCEPVSPYWIYGQHLSVDLRQCFYLLYGWCFPGAEYDWGFIGAASQCAHQGAGGFWCQDGTANRGPGDYAIVATGEVSTPTGPGGDSVESAYFHVN
jgi:hypothetical protein